MLTDAVVVGGGPVGLAVALTLAGEGVRVTVLDAAGPHAAERHGAIPLTAVGTAALSEPAFRFGRDAMLRWKAWADDWPEMEPALVNPAGLLLVEDDRALSLDLSRQARAAGWDGVRRMDGAELETFQPGLQYGSGLYFPDVLRLDAEAGLAALRDAARRARVQIRHHLPIMGLEMRGSRVRGVRVTGEVVPGGITVLTEGLLASRMLDGIGRLLPVRTVPETWAMVEPPEYLSRAVRANGISVRPSRNGTAEWLAPARVHGGSAPRIDAVGRLLQRAERLFRGAAASELLAVGHRLTVHTPDGLPFLGPWPDLEDLFIAVGFQGLEWLYTPIAAELAAAWAVSTEVPMDLSTFRPDRFRHADWPEPDPV